MVVFPLLVFFFFTSLMNEGVPEDIPIGVVDMDNSSTSRSLIRKLDAFQTSKVVAHYNNFNDARQAIQQGKIYAFLYIPKGTAEGMLSSKQPKVSFYYNAVTMVAGSMTFRDLKTITTLGSAAVGQAKMSAIGKTEKEKSDIYAYANEKIVTQLLEVLDNFERALSHECADEGYAKGMEMIFRQYRHLLDMQA